MRASASRLREFAHLPLLVAPDGAKLSKRKHGPVVSVTTYRDAGFLPQAFINFLCLLGWSPKNDREFMSLDEIRDLFTLEGVNRANAVVNFDEAAQTLRISPHSIRKPSGSTPSTSAHCPSRSSAAILSRFFSRQDSIQHPKSW